MIRLSELINGLAIPSSLNFNSVVNFGNIKLSSLSHINFIRLSIVADIFTVICVSAGFIDWFAQQC